MPRRIVPAIQDLLPHGPPAIMLDAILEQREDGLVCRGRIPPTNPFVADGQAPAWVTLEMVAQATAVLEALGRLQDRRSPRRRRGYLVRVRGARLAPGSIPAGRALRVLATLEGVAPPLGMYRVEVRHGRRQVLEAVLSTYLGADGT
jgi:predicted hotdog family 3-hydroxylacyl-ACP dehydratase